MNAHRASIAYMLHTKRRYFKDSHHLTRREYFAQSQHFWLAASLVLSY